MSWLDDEAEKNKRDEAERQHHEEVLRRSNWWAAILSGLENEVAAINSHDHWKTKLAGFAVSFGRSPFGDEHQISKSGYPAVTVALEHKYDHILVGRSFTENPLAREFSSREQLKIGTLGDNVVLITDKGENLIVPDDVVRYLLKAVIESLKITKSS